MSPIIETHALTKRFPLPRSWSKIFSRRKLSDYAVDHVDLAIDAGELFGLVGPNGAGKTTLIKILSTLIVPTSGTARISGHDLRDEMAIKAAIGLATSDERSFYWRLSGRQNLEFFAILDGLSPGRAHRRVDEVLVQVGLQEVADARFNTYSTGMRQRLTIARALLNEPRIIFLDEPTKGVDPTATRRFHELLRSKLIDELGITVVMTTHQLADAEKLCDRLAIIHRGRIRGCGTMSELRGTIGAVERYRLHVGGLHPEQQAAIKKTFENVHLTCLGGQDTLIEFDSIDHDGMLNHLIDVVRNSGGIIKAVSREPISLEKVFDHLTQTSIKSVHKKNRRFQRPQVETAVRRESLFIKKAVPDSQSQSFDVRQGRQIRLHPSFRKTGRIALAFIKRDFQIEISYRFAFFLQIFGILFTVMLFFFIARLLGSETVSKYLAPYGGDYFSFAIIGIAFFGYYSVGSSSFSRSLREAQTTGTLEAMLTSPNRLSILIISSSLWSYLMVTLRVMCYLMLGGLFLESDLGRGNYPVALLILVLTIISASGLGFLSASFIMVLKRGDPVNKVFNSLSILLGGVYFPITILPEWMQHWSNLLPTTYALRAMRLALLKENSLAALAPDILALGTFCLVLLPLSLLAFRFAVRRARIDGSLTHY